METGLILSIGSFLQIQYLFICTDKALDDSAAALQNELAKSNPWPVAFLKQSDIAALLLDESSACAELLTLIACPKFDETLKVWDSKHFGKNAVWLVPESSLHLDGSTQMTLPLQLNSILIGYSSEVGNSTPMELMEHYSLKGHHLKGSLGWWSKNVGLTVPQPHIWERRSKFNGIELTSTFFNFPPMAFKSKDGKTLGIVPDIVHAIQRATNFRYARNNGCNILMKRRKIISF